MELTGTIIKALPVQSGTSRNGNEWRRASYVIEHQSGQYPKRMVFDVLGNKIEEFNVREGENLTVSFDIDAREYNGRWFNSVDAWRVTRPQVYQPQPQPQPQVIYPDTPKTNEGHLPF